MKDSTQKALDLFLSSSGQSPRYLFGCKDQSAILSEVFDVDGFVDDFQSGSLFCGKPVISGEQVPPDAVVVNCVFGPRSLESRKRIEQLDVAGRLDYADLLAYAPSRTPVPSFMAETISDQLTHADKWENLERILADEASRKTLRDVSNFRKTANLDFLRGYSFRPSEQYFSSVCRLKSGDVFVDCGGFDGDTTEQFIRRCPDYRRIYLFEPSEESMTQAKKCIGLAREVFFIPKGVSDKCESLRFDSESGSASAVSHAGNSTIEVTTIDQEIKDPVSFIKMDLEGWELKALSGARSHIKNDHPTLAIAVYHKASDFWRIPDCVLSIRSDYDVYLRHYAESWTETIMYFIPRGS